MDQQALIAGISGRAPSLPGLHALFLSGSFGRGDADPVSDVDLIALVEPDHHAALAAAWRALLADLMPIAHWAERRQPVWLLNAIGDDWLRCDLLILDSGALAGRARSQLRALYDPASVLAALPATVPSARPDPARIAATIAEFIRIIGLLPVIVARSEWVTGAEGTAHLRRLFTNLLLEEVPEPDRGGALHLGRLLPPDHMALLAALPYPQPDRDSVIAAHLDLAHAFLPRARALAQRYGVVWPEHFEAMTRRHLATVLGVEIV